MQLGVLTNQAVKDEKEKGECNGVETLRGGRLIAASAVSATSTYTYSFNQPQNSRTLGTDIASSL